MRLVNHPGRTVIQFLTGVFLAANARQVQFELPNFYAAWRVRDRPGSLLRESSSKTPPEFLVQAIWQQQRLRREQLKTVDGRPLKIWHPGFKNREAGPDFRGAMIQVENEPIRAGDIEVDLSANGWKNHGHHENPAFKNVVLHVLWAGKRAGNDTLPALQLCDVLDSPWPQLQNELGCDLLTALPEQLQGKCCAPLRELNSHELTRLLHEAADVRWRIKSQQLLARARQAGWEQALWEGLFRALGYKQNTWPMQNLAELRARWQEAGGESKTYEARLLGISGLLPPELPKPNLQENKYFRAVWDQWWREREQFNDCLLPRQLWRFNSLRPANHPQRRLALAATWLASENLPARLENWFNSTIEDEQLAPSLFEVLQAAPDEFWSWHWTFKSPRLAKPQPLLGLARVTDLAINVILPWLWIRAVEGKNELLRRRAEHRYLSWPSAEDNSVLKLARQRLLGQTTAKILRGSAAQQGLLQVVKDFCGQSNSLCEGCQFPELVRNFAQAQPLRA